MMPNVECSFKDLQQLVGKKFSVEELKELLLYAKAEIDLAEGDKIIIDVKDTNRPDLWSAEGIAREIRAQLGLEKELLPYKVKKSGVKATVDSKLEKIRPKAAYALVKGVKITEPILVQMIQMQEKICESFGRKRKEVAIGIFDADKVKGNLKYFASDTGFEFVPLGFHGMMSLREILIKHPKGKEYGKLIEGFDKFPLLVDERNEVLSMPPIINSEYSGKITEETRNLFIDVTGFNQELIDTALKVVCMALADRGGTIFSVQVNYGTKKIDTPEFGSKEIIIPLEKITEITGMELKNTEILNLLKKKRIIGKISGKNLIAKYPDYRTDILHAIDVIEDILVAYGFEKIKPEKIIDATIGKPLEKAGELEKLRDVCIGLGLQEVLNFSLTSKELQEGKVNLKELDLVEIANPMSLNWSVFRLNLFPELLQFFASNKHCAFPQRIFEIGKTIELNEKTDTKVEEKFKLCIALSSNKTNFTEIKSALDAVAANYGIECKLEKLSHNSFVDGRSAKIVSGNRMIGVLGEINEKTVKNFGLENKVSVLEIEV